MGQCTSKPNDDKSSLSLGGRNSIVRNSENRFRPDVGEVEPEEEEEEETMSPEDVKGRRPVVRRKSSLLKQQVIGPDSIENVLSCIPSVQNS